ncbi:MAG: MerR family transcriptional regulator [Bacteroidota bacterium]|nr:MerR family transcriptional regulator [Bacteroidota bacterium]
MEDDQLIPLEIFCVHHEIDFSFIDSLEQYGLIEVVKIKETGFIPESRVNELEKLVRLHHELDINLEGIEAITHLLQRVKDLQQEIITLKNKLNLYEDF